MIDEYDNGKLSAIRNPEGIWINSQVFREEALKFEKRGYYCADPWESPAWLEYWMEQRKRCIEGYTVGGAKITGEHYFYLNFCPIKKVKDQGKRKSKKVKSFPDFWDGDYNYFWIRQIAKEGVVESLLNTEEEKSLIYDLEDIHQIPELQKLFDSLQLESKIPSHSILKDKEGKQVLTHYLKGGWNIIVGKSRRKGYSLKSAAIASNNFFTKPESFTIFGAYEKKFLYPKGLFTMTKDNINFINSNTAWATPSDFVNKQDHIRASFAEKNDSGISIESGLMSEIQALTFKDNPDAARGKDAEDIFFEESGAFGTPGLLKDSYAASEDCVMAGDIKTGMITLFGTSGDMEGGTADYADMHSRPLAFGLLPFNNIWDKGMQDTLCGFFHPIQNNMEGFYDAQGNSDREGAKKKEQDNRDNLIKNGATSVEINKKMQEKPFGPNEAFASVSVNNFPVLELKAQLAKVKAKDLNNVRGTPVDLFYHEGILKCKPILDGSATPILSYRNLPTDKRGKVMIYEHPIANAEKGLYKIGYDPIRQEFGTSLAGVVVYKGVHRGSQYHNIIVAEYVGRLESPEDIDDIVIMLCELYNTTVMHENEVTAVKNYFRKRKKLKLLAAQPDAVISKNIKNSTVKRIYGCHMTIQLKDAGERYIKDWLLQVLDYDEEGNPITTINYIYSIRLLEELIDYHRKGNFDLVSALIMCLIQVEEEVLGKEYGENKGNRKVKKLLSMMDDMYQK